MHVHHDKSDAKQTAIKHKNVRFKLFKVREKVGEFPIQASEVVVITSPGIPEGSKHSDNPKE